MCCHSSSVPRKKFERLRAQLACTRVYVPCTGPISQLISLNLSLVSLLRPFRVSGLIMGLTERQAHQHLLQHALEEEAKASYFLSHLCPENNGIKLVIYN